MRRRAKVAKVTVKRNRTKVSAQYIPEKPQINEFDKDVVKEHAKHNNKITETVQQVQNYNVENSSNDSDCTCFSVTCAKQEIYSPVLEDLLTELNISNPERESHIEENDSIPTICSYCGHVSKIPKNLVQSVNNTTLSPLAKCTVDLSFFQAIVWLKSIAASMHEIPSEEYNSLFNVSTKAPNYDILKCQKKTIETNFAVRNKQFNGKNLLNIDSNKPKRDSNEQDPKKLKKENRSCTKISNINDSLDNSPLTPQRWNNTWTMNKCVSGSLIVPESDEEITENSGNVDDSLENIYVTHDESNASVKHDSAYETLDVNQDSIDLYDSINKKKQNKHLQKKRKVETEETSKKRNKYMKENVSTKWVNFSLRTLDTDNIVIESIQIILTVFKNINIIKEYLKRKNWVDTLEKEALDAVLNISNIFNIEMKSDICIKEVIQAVKDILEEIYQVMDLNKVTLQTYHISIILEFCNSLYICNEIIDFLMIKLQHFQIILNNILTKKLHGLHNIINKVHLVLYALSISLQKYMSNIHNNKTNNKQDIPAVINLWRKQWNIDHVCNEKLKQQKNIESWANILEAFTMTYIDDIPLLAEKSRQIYRILIT